MKNKRLIFAAAGLVLSGAVIGHWASRATAAIPSTETLTYSGTLTDTAGAPISGSRNLQVQLWDQATDGMVKCSVGPAAINLVAGAFKVALPAACATAVHASPDLWAEVIANGESLGRAKLGAVPYAVEAETASQAAGALATRLAGLEAGSSAAHDGAGTAMRICTGSSANWQVCGSACGTGAINLIADMSACKFTAKPMVFPVIAGNGSHWMTTGGSAPYPSTNAGTEKTEFEIYLNNPGGIPPAVATANGWRIDWVAIGN